MKFRMLEKLSGWQVTAMVCTALVVPTALYAVTYTPVAIINPGTGMAGYIDPSGSLHTSDEYAYYRNNPLNLVDIELTPSSDGQSCGGAYTAPAGKALVVTSVTGNYYNVGTGNYAGFSLFASPSCSGNQTVTQFESIGAASGDVLGRNYSYAEGVPVGTTISRQDYSSQGWLLVHGFLVPANLVSSGSFIDDARSATNVKIGPRGR